MSDGDINSRSCLNWFEQELAIIKVEGSDGVIVSVKHVIEVDGDIKLGWRKSKYVQTISLSSLSSIPPSASASAYSQFIQSCPPYPNTAREDGENHAHRISLPLSRSCDAT